MYVHMLSSAVSVCLSVHLELRTHIGHTSVIVHHFHERQVVSLSTVIVVVVVCRCDLYSSCAELHINHLICDNGQLAVTEWMNTCLPYKMLGMRKKKWLRGGGTYRREMREGGARWEGKKGGREREGERGRK